MIVEEHESEIRLEIIFVEQMQAHGIVGRYHDDWVLQLVVLRLSNA